MSDMEDDNEYPTWKFNKKNGTAKKKRKFKGKQNFIFSNLKFIKLKKILIKCILKPFCNFTDPVIYTYIIIKSYSGKLKCSVFCHYFNSLDLKRYNRYSISRNLKGGKASPNFQSLKFA